MRNRSDSFKILFILILISSFHRTNWSWVFLKLFLLTSFIKFELFSSVLNLFDQIKFDYDHVKFWELSSMIELLSFLKYEQSLQNLKKKKNLSKIRTIFRTISLLKKTCISFYSLRLNWISFLCRPKCSRLCLSTDIWKTVCFQTFLWFNRLN